jgi:phosphomannomutase
LKSEGRALTDRLDDIARRHGLYATDQLSVRVTDVQQIAVIMARLREHAPTWLGDLAVRSVDDLSEGSDTLPPTDGLRFHLAEHARVIVRPSGTEPKVKCYLQVVVPVDADEEDGVDAARIVAVQRLDAIRKDLDRVLND